MNAKHPDLSGKEDDGMKQKLRCMLNKARDDPYIRKRLYLLSLAALILLSLSLVKGNSQDQSYVVDNSGSLIALEKGNQELSEFTVSLRIGEDEEMRSYSIIPGSVKRKDPAERNELYEREVLHDSEIGSLISEMEMSEERRIELPLELSDGTTLRWEVSKKRDLNWLFIVLSYLIFLPLIIFGTKDPREVKLAESRREIVKSIPRFTNQFLLLMNAGLILSDAFDRIGQSYMYIPTEKRGLFESEVVSLCELHERSGISTSNLVSQLATKYNVKELMRIATFMSENEKRGSDIIGSLSRESSYLWDERKVRAKEQGKSIDTKMAYPLALLLMLLILITMAPVMISM